MIERAIFCILAAIALGGAVGVVTLRNTVHSSLMLGLSLAGVAGLYASLGADFLFAAQMMVYVSGVAVLIMFAVMLLGRASDLHLRQVNDRWLAALLVAAISAAGLWRALSSFPSGGTPLPARPATRAIGRLLLDAYLVPFELISLVLLAALLGAVYFSRAEASR